MVDAYCDTLGWLYQITLRIEDTVHSAAHRMQWRLSEAAGPLERIGAPALVTDRHGVAVAAHRSSVQTGDIRRFVFYEPVPVLYIEGKVVQLENLMLAVSEAVTNGVELTYLDQPPGSKDTGAAHGS